MGVVQKAVLNLINVGNEAVAETSDLLLKRDMPPALDLVQAWLNFFDLVEIQRFVDQSNYVRFGLQETENKKMTFYDRRIIFTNVNLIKLNYDLS